MLNSCWLNDKASNLKSIFNCSVFPLLLVFEKKSISDEKHIKPSLFCGTFGCDFTLHNLFISLLIWRIIFSTFRLRFEHREENRKDCLRTLFALIEEAGKARKLVEAARISEVKERLKANPKFMQRLQSKKQVAESNSLTA